MSYDRKIKLWNSLAFRLTFWHVLLFALTSLAAFVIFYLALRANIQDRADSVLLDQAKECENILNIQGLSAVKEDLIKATAAIGTHDLFMRVLDANGAIAASSDDNAWKNLAVDAEALKQVTPNNPVFATVDSGWHHNLARVVYVSVGHGLMMQIAGSNKADERLLRDFRMTFSLAMGAVTFLAMIITFIISKRALSKVEAVTATALNISQGALESRVPQTAQNDELDRMADTFNSMLDRIQALVKEYKDITDNLAHDLRSPITRMRGMSETTLLGSGSMGDYQALAASTVEDCDRLLNMINTMLAISEAEVGVVKLNMQPQDISLIAQDLTELFKPMAEDKGVSIQCQTPEPCMTVVDLEKIQRAFANLLDNAIKYTPEGGTVTVSVKKFDKQVSVSIQDTGSGISDKDLPHIFERFYRADQSRSQPGNGLGLSLARAFVKAHNGDLSVQSSVGSGSLFTIILPS